VNAALTIQLFSQLFHFINMWSFNKVVTSPTSPHPQQPHSVCYCTRAWGLRLKSKLAQLEAWAERQGLELAADCHLARIIQAAHLLQVLALIAVRNLGLLINCAKHFKLLK
jgi:afadin